MVRLPVSVIGKQTSDKQSIVLSIAFSFWSGGSKPYESKHKNKQTTNKQPNTQQTTNSKQQTASKQTNLDKLLCKTTKHIAVPQSTASRSQRSLKICAENM
jgi:hypothetical protein